MGLLRYIELRAYILPRPTSQCFRMLPPPPSPSLPALPKLARHVHPSRRLSTMYCVRILAIESNVIHSLTTCVAAATFVPTRVRCPAIHPAARRRCTAQKILGMSAMETNDSFAYNRPRIHAATFSPFLPALHKPVKRRHPPPLGILTSRVLQIKQECQR